MLLKQILYALAYLCTMVKKIGVLFIMSLSFLNTFAQNKKHEFRAAWIASVVNIDFPTINLKGADPEVLRTEFIRIADMHKNLGMNALIVQIRPAADALYPSPYEPWSEFLTGKQGKPPIPYFDPLEFMITETHKRGMEFHAWCNPYRAVFDVNKSSVSPSHITKVKPNWFIKYTNENRTTKYFDPGNPEVWDYITNVMVDIVNRYDVDGLHFDDYFYPYKNPKRDFGDKKTYKTYGNGLNKDDWRRSNVDSIIYKISKAIKTVKPLVKFGVSPFGIWRNIRQDSINGSNTNGSSCYDDLYADVLLWSKNKWIDYVAPQLYWEIGHPKADFITLIDWWNQHHNDVHLYIGQAIYRGAENNAGWRKNPNELLDQINLLRSKENIKGSLYFSSKSFERNANGWNDSLKNNYYRSPALIPSMPWIYNTKALAPKVDVANVTNTQLDLLITKKDASNNITKKYVIYVLPFNNADVNNNDNIFEIITADNNNYTIKFNEFADDLNHIKIGVSAINAGNIESDISKYFTLIKKNGKWTIAP
jgi:uncharacterized lipoprotein YddW (UPF0748 family)